MLVKSLFEDYGKVWIKEARDNKINVQVILNQSFIFLLPKEFPAWVEQDKATFFSFLAGFSDAEGTISESNGMAYYSLGNYDYTLLRRIHRNLQKFSIHCKEPRSDNRKGKLNNQGYSYRSNYWTLRVHKKKDLLKLLNELKPHLKHKNKVQALSRAIANILRRNKLFNKK